MYFKKNRWQLKWNIDFFPSSVNLQREPLKTVRATNENANLADKAAFFCFFCPRSEERAHAG